MRAGERWKEEKKRNDKEGIKRDWNEQEGKKEKREEKEQ